MGERLGAGFRPEFRVPDLNLKPVELRNNKVIEKSIQPEEIMTPEQHQNIQEQLDALLRSKDFVHVDDFTPRTRSRNLPSTDFEIVRKDNGKPLTHGGSIVIRNKRTREMFAVSSKNLQVNKGDGKIHYTPSNFAADPKGAQAAAKASHDDPNAPHPVATVFQPKVAPQTAAQKQAEEQALVQQQAREAAAAAAAKKTAQVKIAASKPKSKAAQQAEQLRNKVPKEPGYTIKASLNNSYSQTGMIINQFQEVARDNSRRRNVERIAQQSGSTAAAVQAVSSSKAGEQGQQDSKQQQQRQQGIEAESKRSHDDLTESVNANTADMSMNKGH